MQECERTIDRLISSSQYTQSINTISACIEKTFSGITYYQRYQENILRVLISISLILSLLFNTVLVLQLFSGLGKMTGPSCSKFNTMNMLLLLLCIFAWWCQQLPLHFLFYYTAPVYMLTQLLSQLSTSNQSIKINREVVCILLFTVLICESVVFSFFDRRCLALGIGLIATSFIFRYTYCNLFFIEVYLLQPLFYSDILIATSFLFRYIYCNLFYSGKLIATSFLYRCTYCNLFFIQGYLLQPLFYSGILIATSFFYSGILIATSFLFRYTYCNLFFIQVYLLQPLFYTGILIATSFFIQVYLLQPRFLYRYTYCNLFFIHVYLLQPLL